MKNEMVKSPVSEFKSAWINGMQEILKACKIYVAAIDENPEVKQEFQEAFPKISDCAWARIERVGREQMHYLLLCDSSPAADKIRKLPYSEQKQILEGGIEVLTSTGDRLKIKAENLTREQVKQVIASDHIRDVAAQKAYIESQKTVDKICHARATGKPVDNWVVTGRTLRVNAPTSFSRQQLLNILQDMG